MASRLPASTAVFNFKRTLLSTTLSSLLCVPMALTSLSIQAQESAITTEQHVFQIPQGMLEQALNTLGQQAGIILIFSPELTEGLRSVALNGSYTTQEALRQLLAGKNIDFNVQGNAVTLAEMRTSVASTGNRSGLTELAPAIVNAGNRFGDIPEEEGLNAEWQTTATKMALPLKETPQAISVVTRDSLDARLVKGLYHALELTTGTMSGAGASGGPFTGHGRYAGEYLVRGQLLDPVHGLKTDGFSAGLADIDLGAYERVEVVKGPSGFYGQGPLGGFINLVRKKPQAEFDASISGQVGSNDSYRTEVDITGALTEDQNLTGRLITVYGDEGSFVDDIANETTLFAPSLEAIINDRTRVLLQFLYQKEEFDVNNGQPGFLEDDHIKLFNLPRSYQFGAIGHERSTSEINDLSVRVDHELSDQWLATLLLQRNETDRDIIQGNTAYTYDIYTYVGALRDHTEVERWAGELRLEGRFDMFNREHQVLFGIERNHQNRLRNNASEDFFNADGSYVYADLYAGNFADYGVLLRKDITNTFRVGDTIDIDNSAMYVQVVLNPLERTHLLISARYDSSKTEQNNIPDGFLYKISDKALTMRIGLTQDLTDNISAYATYAESFDPRYAESREGLLDPVTGEGFELGLKGDWLDNRLGATLSVYRQDLDNRALPDPTNNRQLNESFSIAAGLHRTEGVELEMSGSPLPGLNIALAATWMDNEFLDNKDRFYGLSLSGSVDQTYSLYANYELQNGLLKGFGVGMMVLSVGERQLINGSRQIYIDGYERVDFDFSYRGLENWDIALQIRNVLDEEYIEQGSSNFGYSNYVGSPRAFQLQAKYHF